jgi:hypothetical protein
VVVYSGRSADVATDETPYLVSGLAPGGGDKEVVINYTGRPKPALRRGWWLMDGTMGYTTTVNGATVFVPTPQGYFYRVVNVNDDTPNQLIVELQTPTQPLAPLPTTAAGVQRLFVVMDNVVEVFDKGQIDWKEEPHPF